MNIFSFTAEFDSEESCRTHFKGERDKIGVICKRCSNTTHYWIKSQWSYECKQCRSRTSLRSGTIMQSKTFWNSSRRIRRSQTWTRCKS